MGKRIFVTTFVCVFIFVCWPAGQACSQPWSDFTIRSLPDSSFAIVEIDKKGKKVRHFPYRDKSGRIDFDQLIYCLGVFSNETWAEPKNREIARKHLEEHYYRFRLQQLKEEMTQPVNINRASLKELVQLPSIGPVLAVRVFEYRKTHGVFRNINDIKNVEGIGSSTMAGIRYYIKVSN
ncbi:MAG: helix-hairpin-helix domain-containing protein [Proteobacteria bacterium]|nr:helix-hairpin-helix domain-containing protein [Pseudomonadota bacterium]